MVKGYDTVKMSWKERYFRIMTSLATILACIIVLWLVHLPVYGRVAVAILTMWETVALLIFMRKRSKESVNV